jgi:hypothetical protein
VGLLLKNGAIHFDDDAEERRGSYDGSRVKLGMGSNNREAGERWRVVFFAQGHEFLGL